VVEPAHPTPALTFKLVPEYRQVVEHVSLGAAQKTSANKTAKARKAAPSDDDDDDDEASPSATAQPKRTKGVFFGRASSFRSAQLLKQQSGSAQAKK
jgi:hypothetical protein